jgi:uncharacterized protein YrrD
LRITSSDFADGLAGTGRKRRVMNVDRTVGYVVADARGARVGHVESLLFGTVPDHADAVAVRSDGLFRRHFIVPAAAIATVDDGSGLIALSLEQRQLKRFL